MRYSLRAVNTDGTMPGDGFLPDWSNLGVNIAFSDIGDVDFEYAINGANTAKLVQQKEIAVFDETGEVPDSRFMIENRNGNLVSRDGALYRKWQGRTLWKMFNDAIVYPDDWPTNPSVTGSTSFASATAGQILSSLIGSAQARGELTGITLNFGAVNDGAASAWVQTITMEYKAGTTLLQVIQDLGDKGVVECRMVGRQFQAYKPNTLGTDRTTTNPQFALWAAENVLEVPEQEMSRDLSNAALVSGDNNYFVQVTDATSIAAYGRRAMFVSQGGTEDTGTLTVVGQAALDKVKQPRKERTTKFAIVTGKVPQRSFLAGDWIYSEAGGVLERMRVRQVVIECGDGEDLEGVCTVVLNDRFMELEVLLNRQVDSIITGGVSQNDTTTAAPDALAPKVPAGLGLASAAYVDSAGATWATITASWLQVTQNSDNSVCDDLDSYAIKIAGNAYIVNTSTLSFAVSGVAPGTVISAQVGAYDKSGNFSGFSSVVNITAANDTTAPPVPKTPTASAYLGQVRIYWDGLGSAGQAMPSDFAYTEVHISTVNAFTPTTTTMIDQLTAAGASIATGLTYGTPYYVKLISVDHVGNKSAASAQATATPVAVGGADLQNTIIDATKLVDGAVTNVKLANNAVDAAKILDGAVGTLKLAALAVSTAKIQTSAITTALIAASAVTTTEIADNAITTPKLIAGAVTAAKITANTITANEIAANAITTSELAAGAVTAAKIVAGTITSWEIAAGAITTEKLSVGSIGDTVVVNGSFEELNDAGTLPRNWQLDAAGGTAGATYATEALAANVKGGVRSLKMNNAAGLAARAYGNIVIPASGGDFWYAGAQVKGAIAGIPVAVYIHCYTNTGAFINSMLAASGVTTTSFQKFEGNVVLPATTSQIRIGLDLSSYATATSLYVDEVEGRKVTVSAQIADGAITTPKIIAGAITAASGILADASIGTAKIINLAVTDAKIGNMAVGKLTAGSLTADITVSARIKTADTGARVEMNSTGLKAYNSGGTNTVSINSDGSASFTGAVTATSGSFTGAVYASSGSFSGSIYASSGTVGGWTIGGSDLSGSGTISGGTISGAYISGGTISGGAISGGTISGGAISGGTISGTNISSSTVSATQFYCNASTIMYYEHSGVENAAVNRAIIWSGANARIVERSNSIFCPIYASGFVVASSKQVKKNIKATKRASLSTLMKLNVVDFDYRMSKGLKDTVERTGDTGLIAEEVEEIYPTVVSYHWDDGHPDGIDYGRMVPLLIKSIQELTNRINELESV